MIQQKPGNRRSRPGSTDEADFLRGMSDPKVKSHFLLFLVRNNNIFDTIHEIVGLRRWVFSKHMWFFLHIRSNKRIKSIVSNDPFT